MNDQKINNKKTSMSNVTLTRAQWKVVASNICDAARLRERTFKEINSLTGNPDGINECVELFRKADKIMATVAEEILKKIRECDNSECTITLSNDIWMVIIENIREVSSFRDSVRRNFQLHSESNKNLVSSIELLNGMDEEMHKIVEAIKSRTPVVKHYVVILDWAKDDSGERGVSILGVVHSLGEAKKIFAKHIETEKCYAYNSGWEVYSDTDTNFDAGEEGSYNMDHGHLFIEEVC